MKGKKVIAISGYSNSGKTTLLKKVIPLLKAQGLAVGMIKHAHHDIDIDIPGKDSYELRRAGAVQTMVACNNRYAMICETEDKPVQLTALLDKFTDVDLILVEGFKDEMLPKIICHRKAALHPLYIDALTLAVASDDNLTVSVPVLDINQPDQIVQLIKKHLFDE